jgi:hypothetical protein
MRVIKFEYGFQSQNGIVKKVYELSQIQKIAEICDVWNELPIVYIRQFTGLLDKNGVEIYEHDKVEDDLGNVFEIVYNNDFVGFRLKSDKNYKFHISHCNRIEVIGNIHELTTHN